MEEDYEQGGEDTSSENDVYEFLADESGDTPKKCDSASSKQAPFPKLDMGGYTLHPRLRSLTVDQVDAAEDPINEHIVLAEAMFRKGFKTYLKRPSAEGDTMRKWPDTPIWFSYIENKSLEEVFNCKKQEFGQLEGQSNNDEVLLFHGTSSANTDGICRTNFNLDISVRFAYGRGIYLSKYPITSLQYGEALLVCKVLLGCEQKHSSQLQEGYDSLKVVGKKGIYVIRSAEQILPYCVISAEYPEGIKIGTRKLKTSQRSAGGCTLL